MHPPVKRLKLDRDALQSCLVSLQHVHSHCVDTLGEQESVTKSLETTKSVGACSPGRCGPQVNESNTLLTPPVLDSKAIGIHTEQDIQADAVCGS